MIFTVDARTFLGKFSIAVDSTPEDAKRDARNAAASLLNCNVAMINIVGEPKRRQKKSIADYELIPKCYSYLLEAHWGWFKKT